MVHFVLDAGSCAVVPSDFHKEQQCQAVLFLTKQVFIIYVLEKGNLFK